MGMPSGGYIDNHRMILDGQNRLEQQVRELRAELRIILNALQNLLRAVQAQKSDDAAA